MVRSGMTVEPIPDSSVIRITFQNPDPSLVQPILNEIIDAYLEARAVTSRFGGTRRFLTNETVRLRAELVQTDDELRKIKNASGVVSVEDTQKAYAEQISKIRQDIFSAEAELAERQAMLGALGGTGRWPKSDKRSMRAGGASDQIDKYQGICGLLRLFKEKNRITDSAGVHSRKCVGQASSSTN